MKRNRNPTNKSVMKRYATLDSSIGSRLLLDSSSFGSRSFFDRFSFILRSSFVHPPFGLRSGIVRESFGNRRTIEDVSKVYRRYIGGKTEDRRRCIEWLKGNQQYGNLYFCLLRLWRGRHSLLWFALEAIWNFEFWILSCSLLCMRFWIIQFWI